MATARSSDHARPVTARRALALAVGLALLTLPLGPLARARGAAPTVVSLTFDDALRSQYEALPELTSRGLKGTFYVNSNFLGRNAYYATTDQMREVQAAGNEIGGHTLDHVALGEPGVTEEEQRRQVCDDRAALTTLFGAPISFAYPRTSYTTTTQTIVRECGYSSARRVGGLNYGPGGTLAFAETIPPADAYATRTPGGVTSSTTQAQLREYVTKAEDNGGGWVQIVFHDICPTTCPEELTNGIAKAEFTAFLQWLTERPSTTSVKTVAEVISPASATPTTTTTTTQPGGTTTTTTPAGGGTAATTDGYLLVASDGGIFAFGGAKFLGSTGAIKLNRPIVGMSYTPTANGYRLVASDGGIFAFGDAVFRGSTGAMKLNQPIVGMASTPSGNGYWLVASDGGIFAFGDAVFRGSTGAIKLNKPIVGMAPTPTGNGYWLVASDGGIFAFGDARFFGSTGALKLNLPIVGMASAPNGNGYWLVASDGGIFAFGGAVFRGSTGALKLNKPINGMASTRSGNGYWLVASDGGIFAFGDARFAGSTGAIKLNQPMVGMTAPPR